MACELPDDVAWTALLAARERLATGEPVLLLQRLGAWTCAGTADAAVGQADQVLVVPAPGRSVPSPAVRHDARLSCYAPAADGRPGFVHPGARPIDATLLAAARVYLPVLLGAAAARAAGRVFAVGHVTQSLDGRIACANGQSQWIGNAADRRHAHRMRALLDGVLVGASTALADDPQLTVRHVPGPDPRRLVLSGSARVLRAGRALQLFDAPGCEVLVRAGGGAAAPVPHVRLVPVPGDGDALAPPAVLAALAARSVHSVYVEGGARTLSSFLAAGCLDLLQVHLAPTVLGSGLAGFQLPTIDHVRQGIGFVMDHAALDGDLLLSCWPRRN